jgi:hypothetical protein
LIIITSSDRRCVVPGEDFVFGVEADAGSETKRFQCPRYVGNNLDLAGGLIRINYRNANGDIDSYLVNDVTIDGDNVVFTWVLSPKVVMYKGQVKFVVCVVGADTKVKWHTTLASGRVLEGLEPDNALVEEGTADVVAQLIAMVEAQTEAVENTGETWVETVKAEGATQVNAVKAAAEAAEAASVAEIEAKGVSTLGSIPADYTALSKAVRGLAGAIVCEAEGEVVTLSDSSNLPMQGLRIFGRSTQDGTPTPEAPVEIVSIVNPTISVDEQTLELTHTLPGIPVTSGGNYTDSDGQQWICDEVDLERGVYVKRISEKVFDGTENWLNPDSATKSVRLLTHVKGMEAANDNGTLGNVLCTHLTRTTPYETYAGTEGVAGHRSGDTIQICCGDKTTSASAWVAFLEEQSRANTPVTVVFVLATPIETPLSETELAAYRALRSNYPNTTVLNNAGAHMAVKYVADTKLYIDNKIAALTV